MAKRRKRKGAKRKGRSGAPRPDPAQQDRARFVETPAGRLVIVGLAIVGLWIVVLLIYALSR